MIAVLKIALLNGKKLIMQASLATMTLPDGNEQGGGGANGPGQCYRRRGGRRAAPRKNAGRRQTEKDYPAQAAVQRKPVAERGRQPAPLPPSAVASHKLSKHQHDDEESNACIVPKPVGRLLARC